MTYSDKVFTYTFTDEEDVAMSYYSVDVDHELTQAITNVANHCVANYAEVQAAEQKAEMEAFYAAFQTLKEEDKAVIRGTLEAAVAAQVAVVGAAEPMEP